MNVYYLDDPLNEEDVEFLIETLCERENLKSVQEINQIRVLFVLPPSNERSSFSEELARKVELLKNNLVKSGIEKDIGTQVAWIQPKDLHWGTIIQTSIFEITGYHPYIVQRWFLDEELDDWIKRGPRIMDSHGMFGLKSDD